LLRSIRVGFFVISFGRFLGLSSYTKAQTQRQCDEQGVGHSTLL
jgi:hypothetical protein